MLGQVLLLLLTLFLTGVLTSSNYCILKLDKHNSTGGQLNCQSSDEKTSTTAHSGLLVRLKIFHVLWRDGKYETRINGLNATQQIQDFAQNALSPLVISDSLLLEYVDMPTLPQHALSPIKSTLRSLRLRKTQLNALDRSSLAGMIRLELLILEENVHLSSIEDNAFEDLNSLLELRVEQCPMLRALPSGVFQWIATLQSLALIDTGLVTLAPKVFCPLVKLNMLEWSSRIYELEVQCDTFEGLEALHSLTVQQRPMIPFLERGVIHENNQCALCAMTRLNKLDGIFFSSSTASQSCPTNLSNKSCVVQKMSSTPTSSPPTTIFNVNHSSTSLTEMVNSTTTTLSSFNKTRVSSSTVFHLHFTNSTDDSPNSKQQQQQLKMWLPIGLTTMLILILLTAWCVHKRSTICSACKYCHILTTKSNYRMIFVASSKKSSSKQQQHKPETSEQQHNANFPAASMPRGVDAGTFFLPTTNGQCQIIEQDSVSCNNDASCPWPVENSVLA